MKKKILYFLTFIIISIGTMGAEPFQVSLPGNNNFPDSQDVTGARLSLLYGEARNVKGLNVSVLGISEVENFTGLEFDWFFGANRVKNEFKGVALGWVNWHEGQDTGVNIGFVNFVNNVNGVNLGGFNYSQGVTKINVGLVNVGLYESLVDIGFVNYSESTTFQIGLVNATKNLDGLQVGIINYAENGIFPVLPLVNFRKSLY